MAFLTDAIESLVKKGQRRSARNVLETILVAILTANRNLGIVTWDNML